MRTVPFTWRPPVRLKAAIAARAERDDCSLSEAINTLLANGLAFDALTIERDQLRFTLDMTQERLNGANEVLAQIASKWAADRKKE